MEDAGESCVSGHILSLAQSNQVNIEEGQHGKVCAMINENRDSVLKLNSNILSNVMEYVDQFDLISLMMTSNWMYSIARERLYRRITIVLDADFPVKYGGDSKSYIKENGIHIMDSTLVLNVQCLLKLMCSLRMNPNNINLIRYFIFDKCYIDLDFDINEIQSNVIEFFESRSRNMNFLHITFLDFNLGIPKLIQFLKHENVRERIFKLFVTNCTDLYTPVVPKSLTNLFLMLDESELSSYDSLDLSVPPMDVFNSLLTLTCSTNNQLGLEILNKMKLFNLDMKIKLKGLTVFHCHKESSFDEDLVFKNLFRTPNEVHELRECLRQINKKLCFQTVESKIDITALNHLCLKVDCAEHRNSNCRCFKYFFDDFSVYSGNHDGLPNLSNFELESFPNLEWLLPHQILENVLTPLGGFIKSLSKLSRMSIDFSTPSFKMFDNNTGMSSTVFNKLNERLIEAFFLCLFSDECSKVIGNLKTLQLPDFLTSFIYYKPDFYQCLLHSCQCWGCDLVLNKLRIEFFPLEDNETDLEDISDESSYYILIGFILAKLQADREVCIPIKEETFDFDGYPVFKGQPHTLHNQFHHHLSSCSCKIEDDPRGRSELNVDNLVTTYIIHQLQPIVDYFSKIFFNLENLMINGIYYDYKSDERKLRPIFDNFEYPYELLKDVECKVQSSEVPNKQFGYFKKCL